LRHNTKNLWAEEHKHVALGTMKNETDLAADKLKDADYFLGYDGPNASDVITEAAPEAESHTQPLQALPSHHRPFCALQCEERTADGTLLESSSEVPSQEAYTSVKKGFRKSNGSNECAWEECFSIRVQHLWQDLVVTLGDSNGLRHNGFHCWQEGLLPFSASNSGLSSHNSKMGVCRLSFHDMHVHSSLMDPLYLTKGFRHVHLPLLQPSTHAHADTSGVEKGRVSFEYMLVDLDDIAVEHARLAKLDAFANSAFKLSGLLGHQLDRDFARVCQQLQVVHVGISSLKIPFNDCLLTFDDSEYGSLIGSRVQFQTYVNMKVGSHRFRTLPGSTDMIVPSYADGKLTKTVTLEKQTFEIDLELLLQELKKKEIGGFPALHIDVCLLRRRDQQQWLHQNPNALESQGFSKLSRFTSNDMIFCFKKMVSLDFALMSELYAHGKTTLDLTCELEETWKEHSPERLMPKRRRPSVQLVVNVQTLQHLKRPSLNVHTGIAIDEVEECQVALHTKAQSAKLTKWQYKFYMGSVYIPLFELVDMKNHDMWHPLHFQDNSARTLAVNNGQIHLHIQLIDRRQQKVDIKLQGPAFTVQIKILEALYLKHIDKKAKTSNPYVITVLEDHVQRTPTISMESEHPVWNHTMTFETSNLLQSIEVQVHHQPLQARR
jgi:hypothetical protein